jgi:hypothetical protein
VLVSVIPVWLLFVAKEEDDDGECSKDIDEVVSALEDGTLPRLEDRCFRPMILIFVVGESL